MLDNRAVRTILIGLFVGHAAGCATEPTRRARAVAGEYVFETEAATGSHHSHLRRTLTLRANMTWSQTNVSTLNGRRAESSSDSGSFSVHKDRVVVRSNTRGITKFRIAGDTLWSDHSEEAVIDRMVSGQSRKPQEFYFVRRSLARQLGR